MPQNGTLNSHNYDTGSLEEALESACVAYLPVWYRLELRALALSLKYDAEIKKQGAAQQNHIEPLKALTNFKANLQRRKRASESLTSSKLMEIPEPAGSILLSDIAFIFRDEIDDYTQIDFGNDRHVELLKVAVISSISKVSVKQVRPVNEPLDEFFICLKDLFENAKGKPAVGGAHFDGQPKTDFSKIAPELFI